MCPLAFSSYLQAPVPFIIGEGVEGGREGEGGGGRETGKEERGREGDGEGREGVRRREGGQRGWPYAE